MTRLPALRCADCGQKMKRNKTSLPQGKARCLLCRRAKHRRCADCGRPMNRGPKSLPDGEARCHPCRRLAQDRDRQARAALPRRARKVPAIERTCCYCGLTFEARRSRFTVCYATDCRRRRRAEITRAFRQHHPEQRRAYKQARDAAKRGATRVERFTSLEVFERDDWICGICHEPIDRDAVYPDGQSASLDHIIPLQPPAPCPPGTHTLDNVQAAHLLCNVCKGNRLTRELQLAIA